MLKDINSRHHDIALMSNCTWQTYFSHLREMSFSQVASFCQNMAELLYTLFFSFIHYSLPSIVTWALHTQQRLDSPRHGSAAPPGTTRDEDTRPKVGRMMMVIMVMMMMVVVMMVVVVIQWNLFITRSLGPWKLPCYIRFLIISE